MPFRFLNIVAAVLFAGQLLSAPALAEELTPQLDDLVDHFAAVTFGQEYKGVGQAQAVLARWDKDSVVGFTVQGRVTQNLAKMLGRRLGAVSKLTGVKFQQIVPGTSGPSIDILFVRRAEMSQIKIPNTDPSVIRTLTSDPTMVCFFLNWKKPPQRIVKGIVVVNVERDAVQIDSCLMEELTQVMGLPNDVKAYWTTLFNPYDSGLTYSPWDALYLQTLYSAAVQPGMTPAQVRAAVRPVFAEALSKIQKSP